MAVIDLEKFTFVGDTLKGVGELSFEFLRNQRNALTFVSTFGDIKVEKEVGFLGDGGLVGKASSGCDPVPQEFGATTRLVKWTPEDFEVLLHLCYKDLDGTIAEYSRKNGVKKPDLTQTDYEAIVSMLLSRALNQFLWRIIWFGDKNASNVEDGGSIKNGVDVSYFNLINGYWKQIRTQATAHAEQYVDADDYDMNDPEEVKDYLEAIYYKAPMELRQQSDRFILVSQNVYDKYEQYLTNIVKMPLETTKSAFLEGMDALKLHGVEVIAMPEWDEITSTYMSGVVNYALYTSKKVLGVGFEDENDFQNLAVWYDRDTRKVKMEAMGNLDAKLLAPDLFVAGY